MSGNLDASLGGLDAIMQAVVCRQEIGWRDSAMRFIIFATSSGFHVAGDDQLGVKTPNDGLCHMRQGMYTRSTTQDHPSADKINERVMEYAINIIFDVTASQKDAYKKLSDLIMGSSIAVLSEDSANVAYLIEDDYNVSR